MKKIIFPLVSILAVIIISNMSFGNGLFIGANHIIAILILWLALVGLNIGFVKAYKSIKSAFGFIKISKVINHKNKLLDHLYEICEEYQTNKRRDIEITNDFLGFSYDRVWNTAHQTEGFGISLFTEIEQRYQKNLDGALTLKKMAIYFITLNLIAIFVGIILFIGSSQTAGSFFMPMSSIFQLMFSFTLVAFFFSIGIFLPLADLATRNGREEYQQNHLIALSMILIKNHIGPNALHDEIKKYFD